MRLPTSLPRAALLAAGLHVVALSCPSVAWAQSAPPAPVPASAAAGGDAIYLKNGGILRGTIIDAIPNDRARIQLATHEIATVSWGDISRIEHADGTKQTISAPAAATPGAPTDTGPKTLAADKSLVWVHIEGSDDANLEQDTTGQDDWAVVCSAPCDRQVSTAFWYRINGGGMKASKQFSLQGTPGQHETIRVTPASSGWFVAGVIAMPVGGVVAIYGLLFALVGSLTSSVSSCTNNSTGSSSGNCTGSNNGTQVGNNIAAVGWTMVVVGLGLGITGIVVVVNNWKTGATQELGDTKAALLNSAWKQVPTPTWQEVTPLTRALPPAIAAPIFSGSF